MEASTLWELLLKKKVNRGIGAEVHACLTCGQFNINTRKNVDRYINKANRAASATHWRSYMQCKIQKHTQNKLKKCEK